MEKIKIAVKDLPEVPNICNQRLKEVWKSKDASIAYVEMEPNDVSLLHKHMSFTELYYILSGKGILVVDGKNICVEEDILVEIKPGQSHKLINSSGGFLLQHLVISIPAFDPNDVILIDEK